MQVHERDLAAGNEENTAHGRPVHMAVVGRPNSGKSTLVNRLLGEERLLTGPEAGITRDAVAVDLTWRDRPFRVHDTAGLRRRSRVEEKLEKLSVADALHAVRFAEVVVLLMDAQKPFEEQDLRIADLIAREGRALVIGINKWDLVERGAGAIKTLREEADHWLPQVKGVPVAICPGGQFGSRCARSQIPLRNEAGASLPARRRQRQRPRLAGLAKTSGLTTFVGVPAAYAMIWSKMSAN